MATKTKGKGLSQEVISSWFENLIQNIRIDQLEIEAGIAHPQKSKFYEDAITGRTDELLKSIRRETTQHLINALVNNFMFEITQRNALPQKLAFSLSPATILIWAEIVDNDEKTEDEILLAESKVNAVARNYNFSLDTMIVEASDNVPVPPHYTSVNIEKSK